MLELSVMGLPQVKWDHQRLTLRPRRVLFLTFLALEGKQSRSALSALFWDTLEVEDARGRLRLELHRIAHSELAPALRLERTGVSLTAVCDAALLEAAHARGDWAGVAALHGGELLADLTADTAGLQGWLDARREALTHKTVEALEQLTAFEDACANPEAALRWAREVLTLCPLSEACAAGVLERLQRLGRTGEAQALETQVRAHFQRELGLQVLWVPPPSPHAPLPHPAVSGVRTLSGDLVASTLWGRQEQWSQLQTWASTPTPVALLVGEAGVGKSRLAQEWAAQDGSYPLVLRGLEGTQNLPYYALGEALRRAGPARLQGLAPVWKGELVSLWPDLFPDWPARPPSGSQRLLEALSQALRLISQEAQWVVCEDLHELDPASVAALNHALRRWGVLPGAPRFVATVRPGEAMRHPTLSPWLRELERGGLLLTIDLAPLEEAATLQMLREVAGAAQPSALGRRLHALSGGNPYALLAYVQGLREQNLLTTAGVGATPTLKENLESLDTHVPLLLRRTLKQSVARQGELVLRFMEAASLLTAPLSFEVAWAASNLSEEDALSALELSLEHRWLRADDGQGYFFAHDLLRGALQSGLSAARTITLHRRVARYLELHGGPVAERARHHEEAGERARAYPLWRDAAQSAAALWAHREALGCLARALSCTDDPLSQLEVHFQSCFHHKALHDLPSWERTLEGIDALLTSDLSAPDLDLGHLRLARERTHLLWRRGDLQAALAYSQAWTQGEMSFERAALLHDRGVLMRLQGAPQQALEVLSSTLLAVQADQPRLIANLHNALAQTLLILGDPVRGLEHAHSAIAGFAALALKDGLASACGNQADLYAALADQAAAQRSLEQALDWASQSGNRHVTRICLEKVCAQCFSRSDPQAGLRYATVGLELCEEGLDLVGTSVFLDWLERFRVLPVPRLAGA